MDGRKIVCSLFCKKTLTNNFTTVLHERGVSGARPRQDGDGDNPFCLVESVLLITSKVLFVYICKSSYTLKPVYVLNYILNVC